MPEQMDGASSSSAHANRALRGFEMPFGECAAVAHHDNWEDEVTGAPYWNYKIKVFPWNTFGIVTVRMRPPVSVDHLWAATILRNQVEQDEQVITVELGHKPQDDFTFAIDGTGGPVKHTTISCEHNEPPASECGLEPTFAILNNYNGIISPKIHMETWQVGALVDITFRETISIGQTWGAELVGEPDDDGLSIIDEGLRGGVRPSTGYTLRFRLMPLARGLPPERKDSFGFEASPPFHSMPSISCILQKRLPPPPPPSPPSPSPPPPQRKLVDENDCFLGGRMAFVKPPTQVGVPWLIDVTLVHWVPDVLLTLNFVGDSAHELEGHPLQIDSVRPPEAVWMDAQTKHSVTYRLRPVPGGDPGALHIVAFGKVTGLGQVTCCCAPPPPPPPPEVDPPPLPPPPSAKPEPPPPPPFSHIKGLEIDGHEERVIQRVTEEPKVSNTSGGWTQNVFLWVVAALLIYFYGSKWLKQLREHLRFVRMKKDVQKRFGGGGGRLVPDHDEEEEELGNGVELEGGWGGRSIDAEAAAKKKKPRASRKAAGPILCMQLADGSSHEMALDLKKVKSMQELHSLVLNYWSAAGGDSRESLMMEYVDAGGEAVKVTQATELSLIKGASSLNLLPRSFRAKRTTNYGKLFQEDLDGLEPSEEIVFTGGLD